MAYFTFTILDGEKLFAATFESIELGFGLVETDISNLSGVTDPATALENLGLVANASEINTLSGYGSIVKESDQEFTSTVLADDSELTFSPDVDSTYMIELNVIHNCAALYGDEIKFDFSIPTGSSLAGAYAASTVSGTGSYIQGTAGELDSVVDPGEHFDRITLSLKTGSTPGDVTARFAMVHADVTSAFILANSNMIWQKVIT